MTHRYMRPTWWVERLAKPAERLLPSPWIMRALAWAAHRSGETELRYLKDIVPADRLAVDVGAANGVYTWYLSHLASSCVAFEANSESAKRVCRRVPSATVHAVALSDREGNTFFRVPKINDVLLEGWATIETENDFSSLDCQEVRSCPVALRTLDSYDLQNVGFIKIDVEGHELTVLRGAADTIRRWRPTMLIEAEDRHREGAVESVRAWLQQAGYAISSIPDAYGSSQQSSRNMLFCPVDFKK
jgi:FkbM family methyltransferase